MNIPTELKTNEAIKLKILLEDIENMGYTFINEENELVDTAKSSY